MTRRHGLLSTLALVVTGAVVGTMVVACGIRPSGVIVGQEAPQGAVTGLIVYLLDHNTLRPVSRPLPPTPSPGDTFYIYLPQQQAINALLQGPTATEAAGGLTSDIPADTFASIPTSAEAYNYKVYVKSSQDAPLSQHAVDQIACTVITATTSSGTSRDGSWQVQVFDGRKAWPAQGCPLKTP